MSDTSAAGGKNNITTMKDIRFSTGFRMILLISLCFFLTSTAYLSWLYHLIDLFGATVSDALSMIAGYSMQAAGLAVSMFLIKKSGALNIRFLFAVILAHYICMIPAVLSGMRAGALIFGLLMNFFCGMIAAFYLQMLVIGNKDKRCAVYFGAGYCIATVASWILSAPVFGDLLHSSYILIVCLALSALCLYAGKSSFSSAYAGKSSFSSADDSVGTDNTSLPGSFRNETSMHTVFPADKTLLFACLAVFLMSLVKNIGFSFPSSDVVNGLDLELSRLFYAVGLIIAGIASDRNRRLGAICALAALITPFITLSLYNEPVSSLIFWCLDYFVYAFLSVYRVILLSDIAVKRDLIYIGLAGLMIGRLGDAAGTALCMLLSGHLILTVTITALLFIICVFIFFRIYRFLYIPGSEKQKTEQEIFNMFALKHDLSARERTVLELILKDHSNVQISEELFVSESTVKYHIHNILRKTGCKNRVELLDLYTLNR